MLQFAPRRKEFFVNLSVVNAAAERLKLTCNGISTQIVDLGRYGARIQQSLPQPTRFSKHTGGNCLVTGNFLSLQTVIYSSTLCINSRGQCTYLHQSKDLMSIVYESLNQKLKLNPGCSKGSTVGCKQHSSVR